MAPASPSGIEQLASVILLASIKNQASEVRITLAIKGYVLVELLINGVGHEELQAPALLYAPLVEHFAALANIAVPPPDHVARGHIHLVVGQARQHYFELEIRRPGTQRTLHLRPISEAELSA